MAVALFSLGTADLRQQSCRLFSGKNINYYPELPEWFRTPWWGWAYASHSASLGELMKFSFYDIFFP
jgi:hypothetical protein